MWAADNSGDPDSTVFEYSDSTLPDFDSSEHNFQSVSTKPFTVRTDCINVNTSMEDKLVLLPGIGPALAKRIVQHREQHGLLKRVEDLGHIKGIGPSRMEQLRNRVCF